MKLKILLLSLLFPVLAFGQKTNLFDQIKVNNFIVFPSGGVVSNDSVNGGILMNFPRVQDNPANGNGTLYFGAVPAGGANSVTMNMAGGSGVFSINHFKGGGADFNINLDPAASGNGDFNLNAAIGNATFNVSNFTANVANLFLVTNKFQVLGTATFNATVTGAGTGIITNFSRGFFGYLTASNVYAYTDTIVPVNGTATVNFATASGMNTIALTQNLTVVTSGWFPGSSVTLQQRLLA